MTAGLTVCEGLYHPSQFNWLVYKASSGGLSCPDSDARISYYSVSGYPTLTFDGTETIVGAAADAVDGRYYIPIIDAHHAQSVPLAIAITDYSFTMGSAYAEAKVKLFGELANIASTYIRIAVVENNLLYSGTTYNNVLRDMLPDQALTISQTGQEQVVNVTIPMSGSWNPDNLWLIAFVQRDTDKYIHNSTSSKLGEFAVMTGVTGPQQVFADGGVAEFGPVNFLNVGLASDTFDISLDLSFLPDGWDAHMTYDGQDLTEVQIALDMFESASLTIAMQTGTVGSGRVVLNVYSHGAGEVVESLDFVALAAGTDFLVIADDGGAGHAYTAYAPALDPTGKTYAIWDRGLAPISGGDLADYDAVIWASGSNNATLQANDRAALDEYIFGGGRLILAGEDLIESLQLQGGSAALWYQMRLRFNLASGNSNNLQLVGVDGDDIGDGLSFTLTGGDPDQPAIIVGQPVEPSLFYGNNQPAVLRTTYGAYKVVYLPFGLERVPTQDIRNLLAQRSLAWLGVLGPTPVQDVPGAAFALRQNAPNPFNPSTVIGFRTDGTGAVRLEVFNARGQLVRVLTDEVLPAGEHSVAWDGRTDSGERAASGMYFYRLSRAGEQITRKMALIK